MGPDVAPRGRARLLARVMDVPQEAIPNGHGSVVMGSIAHTGRQGTAVGIVAHGGLP